MKSSFGLLRRSLAIEQKVNWSSVQFISKKSFSTLQITAPIPRSLPSRNISVINSRFITQIQKKPFSTQQEPPGVPSKFVYRVEPTRTALLDEDPAYGAMFRELFNLIAAGNIQGAQSEIDRLQDLAITTKERAGLLAYEIIIKLIVKEFREAHQMLEESLRQTHNDDETYLNHLGVQLLELGGLDPAGTVFSKLVSLYPKAVHLFNFARVAETGGAFVEAMKIYNRSYSMENHRANLQRLAICNLKLGRLNEAEELYNKWIESIDHKDLLEKATAFQYLGIVQSELKKFKEAGESFQQSLKFNPEDHQVIMNWIVASSFQGDSKTIEENIQKLKQLRGDGWWIDSTSACLEESRGNISKGFSYYLQAVQKISPTAPEFGSLISSAFLYASRNQLAEGSKIISHLFDLQKTMSKNIFTEEVLRSYRLWQKLESPRLLSYSFHVRFEDSLDGKTYERMYIALHSEESKAKQLTTEFEEKCGNKVTDYYLIESQRVETRVNPLIGLAYRGDKMIV